jgi:oligopeptidase A
MLSNEDTNPLLEIQFLIPFDRVRAAHVEPAIRELIEDARARREKLAAEPAARTYANTLAALDYMTDRLDYALGVVRHLEGVATYPELRAAYNEVEPLASEFYSSIPLDEDLWKALREFAATAEAADLEGIRRRFLTKTIDSFRRHGAELDAAGKTRLAEVDIELSKLTTRFAQNVLDATNAFELVIGEESRLAGLPPSAVAAARQSAQEKGVEGWRFTLQAPSYTAVMTYLDDASVREQMWRAYGTRGTSEQFDNRPIIARILKLRREKAQLVGYRDFADFALADRMAKNGARARQFLAGLLEKTEAHFLRENEELRAFRLGADGTSELQPWDVGYWAEKQRQALYDFDEEALRPYFPLAKVVDGMFEIAGRLFGVRVTEQAGAPVWDRQVKYYAIHDTGGALLGCFYADWYPREKSAAGLGWMHSSRASSAPRDSNPT